MMKLNSECLNITSLSELDTFIKEYESLLVNISYHYSKIKIHYTESYFSNESADSNETSAIYEANNSESVALIIAIIKISLYAIMILVGLVGNVLIILVICLNKFMKNSTNYFILNLAICDLAIIFSCVWIQIFLVLSENWLLGEIFCKVNSYMQMVSLVASVLSLSAVSCNRYFGIMHPLRAKTASGKSYVFIIPIIWTISLIVSLPSFIYRTYREVKWSDYTVRTCDDFGWPVELVRDERNCPLRIQTAKRFYYTTVILFLFFLPIFIMSITYSFITKKLWTNETVGEIKVQMNRHSKGLKKRKKVIIMLVWILIVFFLCWCPLEIILLFTEYAPNVTHLTQLELIVCFKLKSANFSI